MLQRKCERKWWVVITVNADVTSTADAVLWEMEAHPCMATSTAHCPCGRASHAGVAHE